MKALWEAFLKKSAREAPDTTRIIITAGPDVKIEGCYWEREPSDIALKFMGVIQSVPKKELNQ